MSDRYITLVGTEQIQSAANQMQQAADRIQSAASSFAESLRQAHINGYELLDRLENIMKLAPDKRED